MTLVQLREKVSNRVQFNDLPQVTEWINESVRYLNENYDFLHTQIIGEINRNGNGEYSLPADCLRVLNLFDINYESYTQVPYETYIGLEDKDGIYSVWQNTLYVSGNDIVKIKYVKKQAELSLDTDENELTQYYPEIVEKTADIKGFMFLEDLQNASILKNETDSLIQQTLMKESQEQKRNYRRLYYS